MSDVFLSYGRKDVAVARRFARAFEDEGFSVWWDATLRTGETYDEVIEGALRRASAVVVLWSPHSVSSRWVRAEATIADRNQALVPVIIDPCERPLVFELIQTADLGHWQGDRADPAWRALVGEVRHLIESRPAHAAPTPVSTPPRAAPKGDGKGEPPSLAVLPFTNRSGLVEDDVFAIGMVEDLIDALSQGVGLRVISSTASARFRAGGAQAFEAVARDLDVRYLMEGNVRRVGPVLRVTAQLVEAASGAQVWTQRFERPLSELAALQEDLVFEVAAHLDSQVRRLEMERALRKPADLTAWECVTRAIAAYRQVNPESLIKALTEAQRAVDLAPDYGLAHAMLADAMSTVYLWTSPDNLETVTAIRGHVDRALNLEPNNAMVLAHAAEAYNYIGQPLDAIRTGERAVQLSPNFGLAHYSSGVACTLLGRVDDALAHFDAELRAGPGSHTLFASYIWRGAAHVRGGQWDDAARSYADATRINPGATSGYLGESFVAAQQGRAEDARAAMMKVRQLDPMLTHDDWSRLMRRGLAGAAVAEVVAGHIRTVWDETTTAA